MDKEIILVTGGTGLVGSALKNIIIKYKQNKFAWIFSSSDKCDLRNYKKTLEYFKNVNPTYVIHLAANTGGLYKNLNRGLEILEDNLAININVLKCSHILKVKKLVSCLSTCMLPMDNYKGPIDESMIHAGPAHYANKYYSYTKRLLETHCRAYQEQYKDNFICVILPNVYGMYDNFSIADGHVIPALIHKCYKAKQKNEPFVVCGTGKPIRQFIYNKDAAHLLVWALLKYNQKDPIILSVNEDTKISIKQVAEIIANEFNHNIIKYDTSYDDGQNEKTVSNKKLLSMYPDVYFTPINTGIKQTIKWFIDNYDTK